LHDCSLVKSLANTNLPGILGSSIQGSGPGAPIGDGVRAAVVYSRTLDTFNHVRSR
jgi:hypothetical protein